MKDGYTRVRLWQVEVRDKAILFATLPKARCADAETHWIPHSLIDHISRNPPLNPGDWPECFVDLAEWKAEELDL